MGYYICYDIKGAGRTKRYFKHIKKKHIVYSLCFCAFWGLMMISDIRQWLWDILCPGDPSVTEAALTQMVTDIKNGNSVSDAITAFCTDIISHAN